MEGATLRRGRVRVPWKPSDVWPLRQTGAARGAYTPSQRTLKALFDANTGA